MIRFGIIGCGRISEKHVESIFKCSSAELIGLYDPREDRMEALEKQYLLKLRTIGSMEGRLIKHSNPESLLRDVQVDAIVIATPSFSHAEWTMAAVRAGKHVLLEKPLALSLRDADLITELAESRNLHVQICHQLRYRPLMKLMKQWVDSGLLGTIRSGTITVRLNRSPAYYAAAPWRGSWDQDGGMLLNQGIHLMDLLLWMIEDRVDSVYGLIGRGQTSKQTEDVAAGTIRFANGAIGIVEVNTLSQPDNLEQSISLFGDQGTISIGGAGLTEIRRWHAVGHNDPIIPAEGGDEHHAMYEHFVAALQDQHYNPYTAVHTKDGRRSLEAIFALYESARTGSLVRLPLNSFETRIMSEMEPNGYWRL